MRKEKKTEEKARHYHLPRKPQKNPQFKKKILEFHMFFFHQGGKEKFGNKGNNKAAT